MPTMIQLRTDGAAGVCGGGRTHGPHVQDLDDDDVHQHEKSHTTPSPKHSSPTSPRITTPTKDSQSMLEEEVLTCPPPPKATRVPMVIKNRMLVLDEKRHHTNKNYDDIMVVGKVSLNKVRSSVQERVPMKTSVGSRIKSKFQANVQFKSSKIVSWMDDNISKADARQNTKLNKLLNETAEALEDVTELSKQNAVDGRTRIATGKRNEAELEKRSQPARDPKQRKLTSGSETSKRGVTKAGQSAKNKKVNSSVSLRTQIYAQSTRTIKKNALRRAASSALDLKPLFEVNDKVFAPWWPDAARKAEPSWFLGTITHYETLEKSGKYGSTRFYNVLFEDNMSESKGVIDACVFDCEDYLLSTSQGNDEDELEWVGVKNVLDKKSSDMWAKSVGWHETCIVFLTRSDGKNYRFSKLVDALRAYDAHVIAQLGVIAHPSELNLPDEVLKQSTI
ncbi:hypothetical protein ACHAWO_002957 [Cyclotella atomus]|uniref:Uncharacterized protein n=1 Tax=Cyclotella atomus TaxID=382360 RepID=A0ABD3QSQ5_9STRA